MNILAGQMALQNQNPSLVLEDIKTAEQLKELFWMHKFKEGLDPQAFFYIYTNAIDKKEWVLAYDCLKKINNSELFAEFFEIIFDEKLYGLAVGCCAYAKLGNDCFQRLLDVLENQDPELAETCKKALEQD